MIKNIWTTAACLTVALMAWTGCATGHERPVHVTGKIVGTSYTSRKGGFSVPFPVSREVQGRVVHDDSYSVTFHDNWGSKISFYAYPIGSKSPMSAMLATNGVQQALETFSRDIYGDMMTAHYHSETLGGTVSFIYVKPVGPKTGVAFFVSNKKIVYAVETDMLPAVQIMDKDDEESRAERDNWLEHRAMDLLKTMQVK